MARIDGGWGFTYWQNDRLIGTGQADEIRANGGNDFVDGRDGSDEIWLGDGNDIAYGGIGRDTIRGDEGDDVIYGEENSDVLFGWNGADQLYGGADHDTLYAGAGNDRADGGSGRDTVYGDIGNDTVLGNTGDDVLIDYEGANRIDGGTDADGADIDTIDFSGLVGRVNINLSTGTFTADKFIAVVNGPGFFEGLGTSSVVNVEKVIGAALNDTMTGSGDNEILLGRGGEDRINGGGGNDTVGGGYGTDTLTGGSGRDAFLFDTKGVNASNSNNARDIVTDFNPADDTIQLDNAVFTALGSAGPLSADAFHVTSGSFSAPIAADAEDRVLYNASSGDLFYDPDGTAGDLPGVWIARFENRPILTVDDFQIV